MFRYDVFCVLWLICFVGEHLIDVRLYNQGVQDSPFPCNVGDPDLVTIRNIHSEIKHSDLGKQETFESRFIILKPQV